MSPLRVSIVNDYEIIVRGLAEMLADHSDRVIVIETDVRTTPSRPTDVALFDTFGGRRSALQRVREMVGDDHIGCVALYTWDASSDVLATARELGVRGVIDKSASAVELVRALEELSQGVAVGLENPLTHKSQPHEPTLSQRELEVLALLGRGLSNHEIATELFLGVETIRTYARQVFRKLGVSNRTQAATQAMELGLRPR